MKRIWAWAIGIVAVLVGIAAWISRSRLMRQAKDALEDRHDLVKKAIASAKLETKAEAAQLALEMTEARRPPAPKTTAEDVVAKWKGSR